MSLPRYAEYKESGISWIGEVPSHWIKRSLQDTARSGRNAFVDGPFGSDLKSEEYADEGIPLIQLNNVSVGKHDLTNLKFIPEKKAEELARHKATPGDIVIAKMAAPVARAAIVSSDFEQFVIVADCVKLSVDASRWNAKFLQYWINSAGVNAVAETLSAGITRLRINLGSLKKLPVFLTPLSEQTAIATFLDRETGKIDALIAEQEKLLALLAEKRQATISHAVTKGLNPDAPMKNSGVAWQGEVPEHWEVCNLKRVADVIDCKHHTVVFLDDGLPIVSIRELRNNRIELDNAKVTSAEEWKFLREGRVPQHGDMIFCRNASVGAVGYVDADIQPFCMGQDVCLIRPEFTSRFMHYQMTAPAVANQIEALLVGATIRRANVEEVRNLFITWPPRGEQAEIAAFLEPETTKLDALKAETERAIALLKERRSAIIAAAVTGQIDVRRPLCAD